MFLCIFRPTNDRGEKMAISTSTLLAIIGNKYVVGNELPKLQYRTLCDQYVDFCFTMQIIAIGSFLVVYEFNTIEIEGGIGNLGALLNELFFSLQLFATGVFHYWLSSRLRDHVIDMNVWRKILVPEHEREGDKSPIVDSSSANRRLTAGCSFTTIANSYRLNMVTYIVNMYLHYCINIYM